mgnify:CR=1 FL=1
MSDVAHFICYVTYQKVNLQAKHVELNQYSERKNRPGTYEISGVVGIVDTMNEVGQESETVREGVENILYITALIAVNLAFTNLLPIPALDGGHIFSMLIFWCIEKLVLVPALLYAALLLKRLKQVISQEDLSIFHRMLL